LVDFFVTFDYVLAEFSLSFLFPVSKGYVSSVARSVSIHFVSNFGFFDNYLAILANQVLVALKICFFPSKHKT